MKLQSKVLSGSESTSTDSERAEGSVVVRVRASWRVRPHLGHVSAEPQAGSLLTTLDLRILIYDVGV